MKDREEKTGEEEKEEKNEDFIEIPTGELGIHIFAEMILIRRNRYIAFMEKKMREEKNIKKEEL